MIYDNCIKKTNHNIDKSIINSNLYETRYHKIDDIQIQKLYLQLKQKFNEEVYIDGKNNKFHIEW